jgi:hypothetical protein
LTVHCWAREFGPTRACLQLLVASSRTFPTLDFHQPTNANIRPNYHTIASRSSKPHTIAMAATGFALPDGLREVFANVNLEDIAKAITNVTLADFTHLLDVAKGHELNADTVAKLYEEARKLPGAGTTLTAVTLVISIINFYYPIAAITPLMTALGFTNHNLAGGTNVCKR